MFAPFDWKWILLAILGYLIGNIESAVLLSRGMYHEDVRSRGSGNAGSTNMLRVYGLKAGIVTFIGDFLKGVVAVVVGRLICGSTGGYIAGLFAVVGHDFPVLFNLRGGKGVATSLAVIWLVSPFTAAIATLVGCTLIWITRFVSLGSMVGIVLFSAVTIAISPDDPALVILCSALSVLVLIRHYENIGRLMRGTESRLLDKKESEKK